MMRRIGQFLFQAYVVTPVQIVILLVWDLPRNLLWYVTKNDRWLL